MVMLAGMGSAAASPAATASSSKVAVALIVVEMDCAEGDETMRATASTSRRHCQATDKCGEHDALSAASRLAASPIASRRDKGRKQANLPLFCRCAKTSLQIA